MGKKEIRQLRKLKKLGKNLRLAAEWKKPWQSLISTILSARTRDNKTIAVSNVLYKRYGSVRKLSKARKSDVAKIIRPINFYKGKTKRIIACAKMLIKEHNGKVPKDFDELVKLPGVGRKTANVFLAHQGKGRIGVDTHVKYISNKLGWTKSHKQEKVEEDLKKRFPRKYWRKLNYILVRFGQSYRGKKEKDSLLSNIKKLK